MEGSNRIISFRENFVQCRGDALIFFFSRSKRYQEGKNENNPWNVYSNTFEPRACPVLSLAKYLFSNPGFLRNGSRIFHGDSQYKRLMILSNEVIEDN